MESTQHSTAMSQTWTNTKDVRSKPVSRDTVPTGSQPTSPTSHSPSPPPADRRTIDWISNLPREFSDINAWTMKDLMSIGLRYFEEVEIAFLNYEGAIEGLEVLEIRRRFSLFINGDSDLDQRLAEAPEVRLQFVSNLMALVLVLGTGIKLFRPEYHQSLIEDTNRVVEQASKIALVHLTQSASYRAMDLPGFLNATKTEIKLRVDNLYALLPMTRHLINNSDETEPRRDETIRPNQREPFKIVKIIEQCCQKAKRFRPSIAPARDFLSASHGAEPRCIPPSTASNFSTKFSSTSAESASIPSLFSQDDTHGSAHLLISSTITSSDPSENKESSNKHTYLKSTRESLSCKKCGTTFSDHEGLENHPCTTRSFKDLCRQMVLFVRPHRERDKKLAEEQVVRVWHKNGNEYETLVALIDTGCDENLILDSVVGKLGLDKMKTVLRPLKGINGQIVKVSELVQPCWKFEEGSRRHQEFRFFIVSNLPGPSMVLGNIAREELGIHLRIASKALIAHGDPEDLSTLEQQQQKHNEAAHDATESQSRRRQMIAAQRAETYQRVAAANTTKTTMTQQGSTSQKDAAGSGSKKQ